MRRGGSLASSLGLLIHAQLGTFCSLSEADLEGSPLLPNRYNKERDSGSSNQESEPQNNPNDPPPNNPPPQTGDAGTTTDGGGPGGPKIAFVSSQIITGNLGGVAGADATCAKLAADAKVGSGTSTWKAWISTAGTNAIDRMTAAGPWKTVTGKTVAETKADLAAGTLKGALDKDEKGATPPVAEDRVWTATSANGTYVGPDCGGWTGAGSGLVGEAEHANAQWTSLENEACTEVNRIYCFEQ